jgi:hypothetical protein
MPRRSHSAAEKPEHRNVGGELLLADLQRLRVVLEPHERGKRVTVPEIERVHPVRGQEVQILQPERPVVEKGKCSEV